MRFDKLLIVQWVAKFCSLTGITAKHFSNLDGTVTFFLFHRICNDKGMGVPLPFFKRIIENISKRFEVVSIEDACYYLEHGGFRSRYAVLTFDDGYLDNYTLALPVLRQYSVPATLFVCTGFIDSGYSNWDTLDSVLLEREESMIDLRDFGLGQYDFDKVEQRKTVVRHLHVLLKNLPHDEMKIISSRLINGAVPNIPRTMMNWNELTHFSQTSGMTIGAHTVTHPNLTKVEHEEMRKEILFSKKILEEHLAKPVRYFAYPSGIYSEVVTEAVRSAGFTGACLVDEGVNSPGCNMFGLRRCNVMQEVCMGIGSEYSDAVFSLFASGGRRWIKDFFARLVVYD